MNTDQEKIYYGRQWIDEEDIAAVAAVLRGDLITCGPEVLRCEGALAKAAGTKHATLVSSGTAALHLAMMAAGVKAGDEVITTPLTFMASANCALYVGAKAVFADIDEGTWNIDPACVERLITPRTKAVVAVDYAGEAVDHDGLRAICAKHGLVFIEDAAHAIGTYNNGRPVGSLADMTCFSFHPVKTVTAGEGGAVVTDNADYAHTVELARSHGIEREAARFTDPNNNDPWYYEQQFLGYNYRMTDIQAALLGSQLKKLERFKARRQEIVKRYDEAFSDIPSISVQQKLPGSDACRHLYGIRLLGEGASRRRRELFDALDARGIRCQVHYIPTHLSPYYRSLGYEKGLCPVAEAVYDSILSIPLYPMMTDDDVERVIAAVTDLL